MSQISAYLKNSVNFERYFTKDKIIHAIIILVIIGLITYGKIIQEQNQWQETLDRNPGSTLWQLKLHYPDGPPHYSKNVPH